MEIGKIIDRMGAAARMADRDAARADLDAMRLELVLRSCMECVATPVAQLRAAVDSNLGYLTGYMPQEYGNAVLELLDVEHPVFGRRLDVTADEALAAGMRLAEQLREARLAKERRERIQAKRAAGLDIPDVDTAVTSEVAKKLLSAVRASRAGVAAKPVTDEDSEFGALDPQPRDIRKLAMEDLVEAEKAAMKTLDPPAADTFDEDNEDAGVF